MDVEQRCANCLRPVHEGPCAPWRKTARLYTAADVRAAAVEMAHLVRNDYVDEADGALYSDDDFAKLIEAESLRRWPD